MRQTLGQKAALPPSPPRLQVNYVTNNPFLYFLQLRAL